MTPKRTRWLSYSDEPANLPEETRAYAAVVDGLDQGIGRILDALDRRGIADRTFLLFMSDNGDISEIWNHPLRGTKRHPYEGGIRVPAIARWPDGGISGGRAITERVGFIDVYPTLKAVLGSSDLDPNLDGIDILDIMRGKADAPERDWFTYVSDDRRRGTPWEELSLSTDTWKLVFSGPHIARETYDANESTIELFRIDRDPNETQNLVESFPAVAAEMLERLRSFRSQEPAGASHY